MKIDLSAIEDAKLREAYEKLVPKFLNAPTLEQKSRYWKLLMKLGDWELNEVEQHIAVIERLECNNSGD